MKHFHTNYRTLNSLFFTLVMACLLSSPVQAQYYPHGTQHFAELHPDSVIRMNPQHAQMLFEPGEVIVRFRDEVEVSLSDKNGMAQIGISSVDAILEAHQVVEAGKLIPGAERLLEKEILTAPTGRQFERPSLHNIYLLRTEIDSYELFQLIEALEDDPDVLYAEPNYIYTAVGATPMSPALSAEEMQEWRQNKKGDSTPKNGEGVEADDPFFEQQWWIQAVNAHLAWEQSTGDTTQVIAIIDTGVDWTHPDLQNKIWTNPNEIANGQDSDGNGFVDDIRGWDFINNNNNPMDDNSHGTHVAGIAAAEADNDIGIAGVSWGARIMPVKVLQSSGAGTAAVITQGINYAAENGATVINMSLGSYALSLAMQDALANAYATSVLVAAAGNDGLDINSATMFPAAFSFVLGVKASLELPGMCGYRACWSNFDQDGPIYSAYPELYNYELLAPGAQLLSTIPGGSYRVYSGTSMAAPVIAGSASIYQSVYPYKSQEVMWADMIHSSDGVFNLPASLEGIVDAKLAFVSYEMLDTLGGDGDGFPDAGETIEIWHTLRNTGAQADSVNIGLRFAEFEDTTTANILNDHAYIGSMSSYATRTNEQNPFKIAIADDVVHNRDIVFEAYAYNQGETDTIFQPLVLTVEHGTELSGVMDSTLTLYPNQLYLVNQSFRVGSGATLIIKPGTEIAVYPGLSIDVRGSVVAHGTPDSLITVRSNTSGGNGFVFSYQDGTPSEFSYCHFVNLGKPIGLGSIGGGRERYVEYCIFESCTRPRGMRTFNHNKIIYGLGNILLIHTEGPIKYNNFYNSGTGASSHHTPFHFGNTIIKHNNFVNTNLGFARISDDWANHSNNIIANGPFTFTTWGEEDVVDISNNYWGSNEDKAAKSQVNDFWDNNILPMAYFHPMLEQPSPEAHGVVWKVLINGADAQDEFVEPVGVGPQRFDVYFNRPMDIEYTPNVSFGVRYPYNQQAVTDSMSWSADSTVFTAWKTIQLYTGDGINRVRVTGARDPEGFEIPPEYFRFEFLIDAAGAASTNFMATPGMGRVDLTWDDPDELDDFLGFNMYRFEHVTDTTFTEPELINPQLITEPEHTDFDVLPGDKYYYYYKILRTNMTETDSSRVVMGIPHTADPGDANGDYNVDVMDIVAIVAYMLNQNPQPFIFEAADVNQDGVINVMDIVGVVDLIMNDKSEFFPNPSMHPDPAYVHLKDDIVQIESDGQLTAIEFTLLTAFPENVQLTSLLPGHELAWRKTEDGIHGFIFNMQNKCIPEGIHNIIHIQHQNPDLHWGEIFGADPDGQIVEILTEPVGIAEQQYLPNELQLDIFPNPARDLLNIEYSLPMAADVEVVFHDILGRRVGSISFPAQQPGHNTNTISTRSLNLPEGLVFCRVVARGHKGGLLQKTKRVVIL